jgi:hypothetical protein
VPQQITIGQMYVQFQIPQRKAGPGWPVIMVHGSTHTGAALESTPDGREGGIPTFVRKGVATYVVDQSGRGRSGFDQSVLHEAEAKLTAGDTRAAADLIPNFGRITDNGAWTAWFGHLVPAGSNVTNGKLIQHGSPRTRKADGWTAARGTAVPDGCGRRVLQAAGAERRSHAARFDVRHLQSAEPLAGQHVDAAEPGAARRATRRRHRRDALAVGIMGHHMVRILKEHGKLDLLKGLITIEGGCSLPQSGLTAADFDAIPYLALKGDYTNTNAQCTETVDAINKRRTEKQGTARAEYMKLDEMGILGVTHMMMLDSNSNQIAT